MSTGSILEQDMGSQFRKNVFFLSHVAYLEAHFFGFVNIKNFYLYIKSQDQTIFRVQCWFPELWRALCLVYGPININEGSRYQMLTAAVLG